MKRIARLTGLAYLGLAVCGFSGFLFVRQQLYVPDDAAATAANLVEHAGLARLGVAADLGVVLTQALAAFGFFRLFRGIDDVAAGALTAFGLVNSVAVMVATMFSTTALRGHDTMLLYDLNGAAWSIGGLFFGLWLLPMGRLAIRSGYMPRALGWVLITGGFGYIASTLVLNLAPDASAVANVLVVPSAIGEFWMVGYLLVRGVAERPAAGVPLAVGLSRPA
jgi:hypothetical protein